MLILDESFQQMLEEDLAQQGGGRRDPGGFRGRQRSCAKCRAADGKDFGQGFVLILTFLFEIAIIM